MKMGKKGIRMDKIREIIRLSYKLNLGCRKIAAALNISKTAANDYIQEFKATGLGYQDIENLSDSKLSELLSGAKKSCSRYKELEDNFPYFAKELKRKGLTLKRLWEEYIDKNPHGYSYARTAWHYRVWRQAEKITMHMEHKAGDKMFVDFAGQKLFIVNPKTGEKTDLEVFIAILGASQRSYIEAVESQKSQCWISANENAFHEFGGAAAAIVPDNLKSAVSTPDRYEPDINPEYEDFARHYGTVILPARSGKSKDKALVENQVKLTYQRIFAPLRDRIFYSKAELNEAIAEFNTKHNNTPFQRLDTTRMKLFLEVEKDALKPLPATRYDFKKFCTPTVAFNYHVYLSEDKHYYSVPYRYRAKKVKVTYTSTEVCIIYDNKRIASHNRNMHQGGYSTKEEHMHPAHRYYYQWNPKRITGWADRIGPDVKKVVAAILSSAPYPEQAYKSCVGIISLAKKYGNVRVNNACKRALYFKLYKYRAIKNILDKGLDSVEEEKIVQQKLPLHENIRGPEYYQLPT
jgi:transposase